MYYTTNGVIKLLIIVDMFIIKGSIVIVITSIIIIIIIGTRIFATTVQLHKHTHTHTQNVKCCITVKYSLVFGFVFKFLQIIL